MLKDSNLKIAVVIPVYNCHDFIGDCLDSLLAQTYVNWLAYCIDDGSNDKSGEILDIYSIKDNRINVFHKTNSGVASARNYALDRIIYEPNTWISFLDADDYISPYMFENIVGALNSIADETINYVRLFPKRTSVRYSEVKDKLNNKECLVPFRAVTKKQYFRNEDVGGLVASIMVHSNIIRDNHLRFVETMKSLEDQVFSIECVSHAMSILMYHNEVYFYYSNPSSATMSSVDRSNDIIQCIDNIKRIIDYTGDNDLNLYFKKRFIQSKIRMLIKERLKHLMSKSNFKLVFNINATEYNIPVSDRIICFFLRMFNRL